MELILIWTHFNSLGYKLQICFTLLFLPKIIGTGDLDLNASL